MIEVLVPALLLLVLLALLVRVLSRFLHRVVVFSYQQGVLFKRGQLQRVVPAGMYWTFSPSSRIVLIEIRPRVITVPSQEVLTSDGVAVRISLLAHVQVTDARAALMNAESYETALYAYLQEALRAQVSAIPVDDLLKTRAEIGPRVQAAILEQAGQLGLSVSAVNVKDLLFPGSLRDVFAQVAKARQEGLAALERARGETAALRSLANAARALDGNPNLLQLRILQAMAEVSAGTLVLSLSPTGQLVATAAAAPGPQDSSNG